MENTIIIDEIYIQNQAEAVLGRELNHNECDDVYETINEDLFMLIQDSIFKVINFNETIKRNQDAEKALPHYKVYWRNKNAYHPEFKQVGVFKSEDDARVLIENDIITEFDEWRVVMVDLNKTEREIYKINC